MWRNKSKQEMLVKDCICPTPLCTVSAAADRSLKNVQRYQNKNQHARYFCSFSLAFLSFLPLLHVYYQLNIGIERLVLLNIQSFKNATLSYSK